MATVNDLISTFTETELNLTVPLDVQSISETDYETVNEYNNYLANRDLASATTFRVNHPELEKYIWDEKKINILQLMWMNSYIYAKNKIQQCRFSPEQPDNQVEGDIWFKIDSEQSTEDYLYCTCYYKVSDGTYKEFSLLSSAMFEEITDSEIEEIFISTQ